MKKIALALAGASVALAGLAASPAAAADFGGHNRGRFEQVQNRSFAQNRAFTQDRSAMQYRFANNGARYSQGFVNNDARYTQGRFVNNNRDQGRQWQRGERFDSRYAMDYRVIDNPGYYNLEPAPYGYQWVQSGNDAVLVAITSGIIGALFANAF